MVLEAAYVSSLSSIFLSVLDAFQWDAWHVTEPRERLYELH